MTTSKIGLFLLVALSDIQVQGKDDGNVFKPDPLGPGPWVEMTHGAVWPRPQQQTSWPYYLVLDAAHFKFQLIGDAKRCPILQQSLERFRRRTFPGQVSSARRKRALCLGEEQTQNSDGQSDCDPYFLGGLSKLDIMLDNTVASLGCEQYPHPDMEESYELTVQHAFNAGHAILSSKSVWGLLRGLETFSQLVYSTKENGYLYQVNTTVIRDEPKFGFRAIMLDSSRHYLSKKVLLDQLDLMEMNKFNVFHWHLTDDTSFPFQSQKFPNLSEYGAYDPVTHVYTPTDVREIIEAARQRGIRVIPEFDTPGHTKSWEKGVPGLLTACEDVNGTQTGIFGPMDPTRRETFDFLAQFYGEIVATFPDKYVHIGGDEVSLNSCWHYNQNIDKFLKKWNMTKDYHTLESFFVRELQTILAELPIKKRTIVWQEIFDNGGSLRQNTIIDVWKSWGKGWEAELSDVTRLGFDAVLSAPWYLNYMKYGSDWVKFYKVNPLDFYGSPEQKSRLLGGQVCLWGEFVNSINAIPRLWPRASAAGERLWTTEADNLNMAAARLQEHECRMMARGYPVQPVVGAGFCPVHWNF